MNIRFVGSFDLIEATVKVLRAVGADARQYPSRHNNSAEARLYCTLDDRHYAEFLERLAAMLDKQARPRPFEEAMPAEMAAEVGRRRARRKRIAT